MKVQISRMIGGCTPSSKMMIYSSYISKSPTGKQIGYKIPEMHSIMTEYDLIMRNVKGYHTNKMRHRLLQFSRICSEAEQEKKLRLHDLDQSWLAQS
ncbi:MAG TPA: hypothetical protein DCS30_03555 [Rhizobiales bacterium]|nr:hypothetical protein [Hyphomicrobiales bacterium]